MKYYIFFFFCLHNVACGILVSRPGDWTRALSNQSYHKEDYQGIPNVTFLSTCFNHERKNVKTQNSHALLEGKMV